MGIPVTTPTVKLTAKILAQNRGLVLLPLGLGLAPGPEAMVLATQIGHGLQPGHEHCQSHGQDREQVVIGDGELEPVYEYLAAQGCGLRSADGIGKAAVAAYSGSRRRLGLSR